MKAYSLLIVTLLFALPHFCKAHGTVQYADINFYLRRHGPQAGYIVYKNDTLKGIVLQATAIFKRRRANCCHRRWGYLVL